jgi:hypothetical protein
MLGLPLAFTAPLLLGALIALPVLWFLLRLTPPPPKLSPLPTLPLIRDLAPEEQRPTRTPWWLLLLRCLIAALIILAMAGPVYNPEPVAVAARKGPLVIVMDEGWAAAQDWPARTAFVERTLTAAADRPVALRTSSETEDITPGAAAQALEKLRALEPRPHSDDRRAAFARLTDYASSTPEADIIFVSDGVTLGQDAEALSGLAAAAGERLTVIDPPAIRAVGLAGSENTSDSMTSRIVRIDASQPFGAIVRAVDQRGRSLGETSLALATGQTEAPVRLDLPLELRNEVNRLEISGIESAGAVQLIDAKNRRRRVGLISGETTDTAQPLISAAYFIRKALEPFAEIREAPANAADPIERLIDDGATMLILADIGTVSGSSYEKLKTFVENGGVLVRFAGLRLAGAGDDLLPVTLRRGGRTLGGALSWGQPKKLAPFPESSPFQGLAVPEEVTVSRQVLAEPTGDMGVLTWASLEDGTPLVTGAARGKGVVALFHITADTSWSSLPLSGLFVDMLRRLVATANSGLPNGETDAGADLVSPARMLDGYGRFAAPPATAKPVARNRTEPATADHPAGFYGPQEGLVAVNVLAADARPVRLAPPGGAARVAVLSTAKPLDLRPPLMVLALLLFALDAIAAMLLAGAFSRLKIARKATAALAIVILGGAIIAEPRVAMAQSEPPKPMQRDRIPDYSLKDIEAALETRLAYVITGDNETDTTSREGLAALSRYIAFKTSLEPAEPAGVDPAKDELVFYPVLYWPMTPNASPPSQAAIGRLDAYMRNGGTVIFDTRDAFTAPPGGGQLTPETAALRMVLGTLDVPALEPIPADHVVTKSFYLLDAFVGRYTNGQTWIESLPPKAQNGEEAARPARAGDRVSPIIITSNDLAGAWAVDEQGNGRYPLVPDEARQREMAFRAGVNIVMYALTGNYKTDQVHVPDLLERLGQ